MGIRLVPNRPRGEAQPFYHCIVDERDRPGRQGRYVAEENIELCEFVFPAQGDLVDTPVPYVCIMMISKNNRPAGETK